MRRRLAGFAFGKEHGNLLLSCTSLQVLLTLERRHAQEVVGFGLVPVLEPVLGVCDVAEEPIDWPVAQLEAHALVVQCAEATPLPVAPRCSHFCFCLANVVIWLRLTNHEQCLYKVDCRVSLQCDGIIRSSTRII